MDPPYRGYHGTYGTEAIDHDEVRAWAIREGAHSRTRIVLCGHAGDYDMPDGWSTHEWERDPSLGGGTGERECLWMSPACIAIDNQRSLFPQQHWI